MIYLILAKCKYIKLFDDELKNIDNKLKQTNKDLEKKTKINQNKIDNKLNDKNKEQDNEIKSLIIEI